MNGSADDRPPEAKRLEAARIRRGCATAQDASDRFGWNYDTYIHHERGTRGLKPKVAAKYAKAYKVSSGWLLTGEGDDPPPLASEIDESKLQRLLVELLLLLGEPPARAERLVEIILADAKNGKPLQDDEHASALFLGRIVQARRPPAA